MESKLITPGSLFGGMLLIAGSCIGAGMLALPIITGMAGFFPSLGMLFLGWAFMTFTGLLLIEAAGWFYGEVDLLTMVGESLGKLGRIVGWVSYLFLFYSLLVAYVSASGTVFSSIFNDFTGMLIPSWAASVFFTALFGWIIYLGTRPVDLFNRVLMAGLIAAYLAMIGAGIFHVHPSYLLEWAPEYLVPSIPILVLSFGFQNLIPSLTAYMKGDLRRVRLAILGGGAISFGVYLIWTLLVLGVVPHIEIFKSYSKGEEATRALREILGYSSVSWFAQGFAFFAIVTSFLAQGLTLSHFLADGFGLATSSKKISWLILLALLPPLGFALFCPQVFFRALHFAGGICAMVLFGILPTLMVWRGRYLKHLSSNYHVPGGKGLIIFAFLFSLFVLICELTRIFLF